MAGPRGTSMAIFASAGGHSTVDYYIASVHCMTAATSLHLLKDAGKYGTDHNPLILHVACDTLKHAPTPPSTATRARVHVFLCSIADQ